MNDINFTKQPASSCALCAYFMLPEDCPPATQVSVGIGQVCADCKVHTESAFAELADAPGIAPRPLEDGEKRNCSHVTNCTALHQRKRRSSQSEGGQP